MAGVAAEIGCGLTRVACGCMFMADATRQRISESRAPQSCARSAAACRGTLRCGRTVGPGLLHFTASSLSLPRTSSAVKRTGPTKRRQAGIHGQASTQLGSACADVRCGKRTIHQRGSQPSVARSAATRARAWVSRSQFGNVTCSWNIDSTVCCQTSSRTCINCSCRISASQSEAILRNRGIQRQE